MNYAYKEVHFDQYCKKCTNEKTSESENVCDECLNYPVNLNSHKPTNFQEK